MRLASHVSSLSVAELEQAYAKCCKVWETEAGAELDELDEDENANEDDGMQEENECMNVINSAQADCSLLDPAQKYEEASHEDIDMLEADFGKVPDEEVLRKLLQKDANEEPVGEPMEGKGLLPRTLLEALDFTAHEGEPAFWNGLFRLCVFLRATPGGCDVQWIPRAKNTRRASRKLNWYQFLGFAWDIWGQGKVVMLTLRNVISSIQRMLFHFVAQMFFKVVLQVWPAMQSRGSMRG